jgi:hypothetical protein
VTDIEETCGHTMTAEEKNYTTMRTTQKTCKEKTQAKTEPEFEAEKKAKATRKLDNTQYYSNTTDKAKATVIKKKLGVHDVCSRPANAA